MFSGAGILGQSMDLEEDSIVDQIYQNVLNEDLTAVEPLENFLEHDFTVNKLMLPIPNSFLINFYLKISCSNRINKVFFRFKLII